MALAAVDLLEDATPLTGGSLIGRSRAELADVMRGLGEPERTAPMRARQLWHWLYHRGVADPAATTTLPTALRERLAERYRNEDGSYTFPASAWNRS